MFKFNKQYTVHNIPNSEWVHVAHLTQIKFIYTIHSLLHSQLCIRLSKHVCEKFAASTVMEFSKFFG
jgi:hypothetical protein